MNGTVDAAIAPESVQSPTKLTERRWFQHIFMSGMIFYILLCAYFLVFTGSVLVEGIVKGWWRTEVASASDAYALWWSYLTAFPCLLGVIGGLAVLSTGYTRFFKIKLILFFPTALWSVQLTSHILINWGFEYWEQFLFLVPLSLFCWFMVYGVYKRVSIPILTVAARGKAVRSDIHAGPDTHEPLA